MASISIQGRVDGEQWAEIRGDRTVTEALQKVVAHYQATSAEELEAIAPTPAAAIAILLHSHQLLNQLFSNAAIAIPTNQEVSPEPTPAVDTQAEDTGHLAAIASADDW